MPRPLPCAKGLRHKNVTSGENQEEKKVELVS